mmetsp:Transcript_13184/g.36393  ORF Transcript_13184/g.36393 Transcript_13184/m.36393 type:complete len:187 (+) Transcript_13184:61-621(+)
MDGATMSADSRAELLRKFRRHSYSCSPSLFSQKIDSALSMSDAGVSKEFEDASTPTYLAIDAERTRSSREREEPLFFSRVRSSVDEGIRNYSVRGVQEHIESPNTSGAHRRAVDIPQVDIDFEKTKKLDEITISVRKLDISSVLDRCGDDLELLHDVMERCNLSNFGTMLCSDFSSAVSLIKGRFD